MVQPLRYTRFGSAREAGAAVDAAVRKDFNTYRARLKFEVDFNPQGQPQW